MSVQITFNQDPFDIQGNSQQYLLAAEYLYCIQNELRTDGNGIRQCHVKCFPILDKREKAKILLTHSLIQ